MKGYLYKTIKILFPFILGGGILYWMYRGFNFQEISQIMLHEMKWEWMILSFIPGILAQVFRGLRWHQTLTPMKEEARISTCIHSIFLSYAASLVIPRIGEILRCGVLTNHDGTSFTKAIGTVLTERLVDTILMLLLVTSVFLLQIHVFIDFFDITGVNFTHIFSQFTSTGIFVTVLCLVCLGIFTYLLIRHMVFMRKVKSIVHDLLEGIFSLRQIRNKWLYFSYSIGIWVAYFLHYYLTFYCFSFTENLGIMAGLISFCVGTVAVIVPTPNGAGPWHFAVKTILVIYGLTASEAVIYALIVHSVQTLLLIVLGIYALVMLCFQGKRTGHSTPLSSKHISI